MSIMPTWDLFITLFFVIGIAYGFILQRDKVVLTMIAVYVALVITSVTADPILQFFSGEKALFNQFFIRGINNIFYIKTAILGLTIGLVTTKSGLGEDGGSGVLSQIEILAYSVLNSALIASSVLSFMPEKDYGSIIQGSQLLSILVKYHTLIVIAPVVMLIVMGMRRKD